MKFAEGLVYAKRLEQGITANTGAINKLLIISLVLVKTKNLLKDDKTISHNQKTEGMLCCFYFQLF
ncbi:MAG: hypothetical protein ACI8YQ_002381 [Polaribacter sp.]|jgi:hypothetical protein